MKIAISGGTGFIGKHLVSFFQKRGYQIFILSRQSNIVSNSKNIHYVNWLTEHSNPEKYLEGIDVFINLAGTSIDSHWNEKTKIDIQESRIRATNEVIRIIKGLKNKPKVLINASAIGIYGTSLEKVFTEKSDERGNDFLADTVSKWEECVKKLEEPNVRVVLARFGVVLHPKEGALPKIALPYQFFAGGPVGSGKQWISWVHIDEVVNLISFAIEHEQIKGPINFTSPNPVTMNEFGQNLAKVLNRPHWLNTPSFLLKTILGEKSMLVLEGQKVLPEKAMNNGYEFLYPTLQHALMNLYKGDKE